MSKRRYPILEFDFKGEGKIKPSYVVDKYGVHDFPANVIICFFKEVINDLFFKNKIEEYLTINGENSYHFFKYKDKDIAIVHGSVGAPACIGQVEEAIAFGAKRIMFCGGAGSLDKSITVGKVIVIDSAIRDEGVSYHYLKPGRQVNADSKIVNTIKKYLEDQKEDFVIGKTWTTDAFYRETEEKIKRRKKEGAIIVEMEQASILAVAKFRKVKYGAIIYSGDDLSKERWDSRDWRHKVGVREKLVKYCEDIVELI
ncbi:nucleoside phosphorylase [Acholeplasma sp. OttesenSCG-928-E16]|nr:nucleoside phosphorylase [Acholeplasma sp. OttesenSCG-928-E16]